MTFSPQAYTVYDIPQSDIDAHVDSLLQQWAAVPPEQRSLSVMWALHVEGGVVVQPPPQGG